LKYARQSPDVVWYFIKRIRKGKAMELVLSLLIVIAGFAAFATISYFLVKSTFSRIENDEWEERYIQFKKETKLVRPNPKKYHFQKSKIASVILLRKER
jgi:hypothetical protein